MKSQLPTNLHQVGLLSRSELVSGDNTSTVSMLHGYEFDIRLPYYP